MKKRYFNSIVSLIIISILLSCENKKSVQFENDKINESKQRFDLRKLINLNDTLFSIIEFNDCGEYGGHQEFLNITKNEIGFNAYYLIDSVPCEIISVNHVAKVNDKLRTIIYKNSEILSDAQIGNFNQLINEIIFNSDKINLKSNSSVFITLYSSKEKDNKIIRLMDRNKFEIYYSKIKGDNNK